MPVVPRNRSMALVGIAGAQSLLRRTALGGGVEVTLRGPVRRLNSGGRMTTCLMKRDGEERYDNI